MQFTIRGQRLELTKDAVNKRLAGVAPGITRRYFVSINGINYPIKQIVSVATGLPAMSFSTTSAYGVIQRLGFKILEDGEKTE